MGSLGEFKNGVNFGKEKKGKGIHLINVKDIFEGDGRIHFESLDRVALADKKGIEGYYVKAGDLFFVRSSVKRDGVGLVGMAQRSDKQTVHCGFVIRLRLTTLDVDPLFLTYQLRSPYYRQVIIGLSSGAAITNISQDVLGSLPVTLPSLATQHKVASILSAYDDLIENNHSRIRILEEMARAIYREWFWNFRFLGHENVRMVDSELGPIPERWEVKRLGNVLAELESGKRPKGGASSLDDGVPSVGAENVIGLGCYDYSKEKYVSRNFFESMKKGRVRHKDVLLYKDGAQIGRKTMFRNGFPHEECCINEHVFILHTNNLCTQNYLYFWLDQPEMTQNIRNLNANAAQPGINQAGVKGLCILVPTRQLLNAFEEIVEPILNELFTLAKKNNIIRRTRDMLLPKLISGELDVEGLDINTEGLVR